MHQLPKSFIFSFFWNTPQVIKKKLEKEKKKKKNPKAHKIFTLQSEAVRILIIIVLIMN